MRRPNLNEYGAYYSLYIDLTRGANYLQLLQDSSDELLRLFDTISEEKSLYAYAEGKWTLKEMLQHIIDTDAIFGYRALCLSRFEEGAFKGYDQDVYAKNSAANARPLKDMLEDFKNMRAYLIGVFKGLNEKQLNNIGEVSGNATSTLAIAFILSGHVFHHINIIKERYL